MRTGFLGALAALALVVGLAPASPAAAGDITVYVTFEGYNLGQGYYVEPVRLTVPAGTTAAAVTESVLDSTAHPFNAWQAGDTSNEGWYLAGVKGFDKGTVAVPSYITSQPDFELTGSDGDDYLGTPDYNSMSGWMYTVDDVTAQVGAGAFTVHDGDVLRWQFTLYGYGCDLGLPDSCYDGTEYFHQVGKAELIRWIGNGTTATATAAELVSAKTVAVNPTATQQQVSDALTALEDAPEGAPAAPTVSAATTQARQAGAAWLAGQLATHGDVLDFGTGTDWGLTEDAVFALAGAGVGGTQIAETAQAIYHSGTAYVGTPANLASRWPFLAKTVLALQIAGLDPTQFPDGSGTRDLVADLRSSVKPDGSWKNSSDPFKTSLGILALARTADGVPAAAVDAFEQLACATPTSAGYGAFGFSGGCSADVDTTSMAVQALLAAGVSKTDPVVVRATDWMLAQSPAAGFPSSAGPGNTNSAGLGAQALFAVGKATEATQAAAFIQGLQVGCSTVSDAHVTAPAVVDSLFASTGAIGYNAAGWTKALGAGITSTNLDQWRRASAQAVLGLGAESLGFVSAANATPGVPAVTCPVATSVAAAAAPITYGRKGAVVVTVAAARGSVKPTGTVSTKIGTKTVTGTLVNARATLALPAGALAPGTRSLVVSYSGSGAFTGSARTIAVKVVKATSTVKVTGPATLKRGKTATYVVTVAASGVHPTGTVTVTVGGRVVKVAVSRTGRAVVKVKVAAGTKPGAKTATATYQGDGFVAPGRASTKTRVTR